MTMETKLRDTRPRAYTSVDLSIFPRTSCVLMTRIAISMSANEDGSTELHALSLLLPAESITVPGGHRVQFTVPSELLYVPNGQDRHAVAVVILEYFPGAQAVHFAVPLPESA